MSGVAPQGSTYHRERPWIGALEVGLLDRHPLEETTVEDSYREAKTWLAGL